jgi:hypothetical protein
MRRVRDAGPHRSIQISDKEIRNESAEGRAVVRGQGASVNQTQLVARVSGEFGLPRVRRISDRKLRHAGEGGYHIPGGSSVFLSPYVNAPASGLLGQS